MTDSTGPRDSESDVRKAVAELLRIGPRRGVARLLADHVGQMSDADGRRLETLVRALCAQNSTWRQQFKKRVTLRAKCPASVRGVFERALVDPIPPSTGHARITATDVLRRMRTAKSEHSLTIKDQYELGIGPESRFLFGYLHTFANPRCAPVALTVHIECDHLYVHGLGLLATWCERFASSVRLVAASERTRRYLDRTGFRKVVEGQETIRAPEWDGEHHVALTRVDREEEAAADEVARRLTDLFHRHVKLDQDQKSALTTVFAELVENVYRHAQSNYGSYVMAQAYPNTRRLHIVVADSGIGIYRSLRESQNKELRQRVKDEPTALRLAMEKLVTSKAERHAGYGLFVVRRLIELNGGTLRLTSGRTTIMVSPINAGFRGRKVQEDTLEHLPWNGTEISLIFNLDEPLPLRQVYAELGPPDRPEDFFD